MKNSNFNAIPNNPLVAQKKANLARDNIQENYQNDHEFFYETLGTLGNEYSCSCVVAKSMRKAQNILLYPRFEDASIAVKEGKIQSFLVPGAYPNLGQFIMDKLLKVQDVKIVKIPSLVLAGKLSHKPEGIKRIYMHPAVIYLLDEVGMKYAEMIRVNSNPEACEYVNNYPESSIAITNQPSAEYYNLNIYEVLREGIDMPFILFVKN